MQSVVYFETPSFRDRRPRYITTSKVALPTVFELNGTMEYLCSPDTWGGIPYSTAKVGMVENAQVVFTTSTSEFYCQLSCSFDELNDLMEKIATACENGATPDMTNLQEKVSCLAKYSEDDSWYRGYVEEKSFDSAKVLFVDYGNRENVPFDKIKTIPEDMCTLPVQAIKCKLFGVPESADTETFKTIVSEKTLKTHFVSKHFSTNSFEVVLLDEDGSSNVNALMGATEEALQISLSKEEEEGVCEAASRPNTVYVFGDSHARDQAAHLNAALKGTYNVLSTCCPGWPLNEVIEKAVARLDEFAALSYQDFIVVVGGSNDTSEPHQKKLFNLYEKLFTSLPNTNVIVCETPFRFDEVEKNTEIAKTNNMVAQLCNIFTNVTFLPMINSMQRYHFTNHGLHMKQTGKRILSGLISNCIRKILWESYLCSLESNDS